MVTLFPPSGLSGGSTATGSANLTGPAAMDFVAGLSSSLPSTSPVPATVTVPAGSRGVLFKIPTAPVASDTSVTISAEAGGVNAAASLPVKAPGLRLMQLWRSSVTGGAPFGGYVYLTGAAPAGGMSVPLVSSDASVASVPGSVTVPAGQTVGAFPVTTSPQASDTPVTITADPGGANLGASLLVKAPALASLTFSPTSLKGGGTTRLTVLLDEAAPSGGRSVSLSATAVPSENAGALNLPASVTVAAGARSVGVTVLSSAVSAQTVFTVTGSAGDVSKQATVTLDP